MREFLVVGLPERSKVANIKLTVDGPDPRLIEAMLCAAEDAGIELVEVVYPPTEVLESA